jgi:hypothetical protein
MTLQTWLVISAITSLLSFVNYSDIPKLETRTLARRKSSRAVTILSNYQ